MSIKDKLSNPLTGLAIVISFSLIAIFTMAILVELKKHKKPEVLIVEATTTTTVAPVKKPRKMCDSPECITLSYQLLNWRDPDTDPCQDFYKFTCGRFSATQGSKIIDSYPNYAKTAFTGSKSINFRNSGDREEYEKKGQCLVKQYEEYEDPVFGKGLNGTLLIHQLLSDLSGAISTFNTFKNLDFSEETIIPGFKEGDEPKLFFQIYAMNYCSPPNQDRSLAEKEPTHSFRVNGIFSNMKQFAETFNCPTGSAMNPETRCELL